MKNLAKILFLAVLLMTGTALTASAASNYAISGLCIGASQNYGSGFFDVSSGAVYINGKNYSIPLTGGLLAQKGGSLKVYAYEVSGQNKAVIGLVEDKADSNFFNNGVLIGTIYTDQLGSATNIGNYTLGCSNYISQANGLALNDKVVTISNLNVRTSPFSSGKLLSTENSGSLGVVVDGPVVSDSYNWIKVKYDSGAVGWSALSWLSKDASVQSYVAQVQPSASDLSNVDLKNASVSQMASVLETAKIILDQIESVLKNR